MWECSHSRPHRDWQQQDAHQFYDIRQRYKIQRIHGELRRLVNTHYFIRYHLFFNNIEGFTTIIIKQSLISAIEVGIRVSDQSVVVKNVYIICTILYINILYQQRPKLLPRIYFIEYHQLISWSYLNFQSKWRFHQHRIE